jgi:Tol biopolymer transport system component
MAILRVLLLLSLPVLVLGAEVNQIVVDRFLPNKVSLYVANADGTNEKLLLQQSSDLDYNGAYSADGKSIVFTSERDGSSELYKVKSDGTGIERLTDNIAYDDQAFFSPDGRRIVFVSTRDGGHANLWTLDVATHKVTRLTNGLWSDLRPSWSPNGQWIAFSSDRDTPYLNAAARWEQLNLLDIWLIKPDGTGLRQLTNTDGACGSPKWSRDGQRLIAYCMGPEETFANRAGQVEADKDWLTSIDVETGRATRLVSSPGTHMSPAFVGTATIGYVRKDGGDLRGIYYDQGRRGPRGVIRAASWSPDGAQVIYHKFEGARRLNGKSIWIREPDFKLRLSSEGPDFNKKGDKYLTSQVQNGHLGLYVIDANTAQETLLYEFTGGAPAGSVPLYGAYGAASGAWSPKGDEVAFSIGAFFSNRPPGAQIFTIKVDGTGLRQLTNGPNSNSLASYSPDGTQLLYRTIGPDGNGLRIMNLADGTVRKITDRYDNFTEWSPRGDLILFSRQTGVNFQMFTIKPDGTDLRQLTFTRANDAHGVWSPDGEWILFPSTRMGFKDEGIYTDAQQPQGELFVMRYDGTHVRQLTDNQWEDGMTAWRPGPVSSSAPASSSAQLSR